MYTVLVIGSGAREDALCMALSRSQKVKKIYSAPGNPGMERYSEIVLIGKKLNNDLIIEFCKANSIDCVVVGPEAFLVSGLVDACEQNGIYAFGPSAAAARIEGSKIFMKEFCAKYGIPTAQFATFTQSECNGDLSNIFAFAQRIGYPCVLKTDGLAAGKGVVICNSHDELEKNINEYFSGRFGSASKSVVLEEFLDGGIEVSAFAIADGESFIEFSDAGDYKRIFDNDNGPNTGGMGTYSPSQFYTDEMRQFVSREIFAKLVSGMKSEGCRYKGVIFAGLMLTTKGVRLIEFNCRLGDPETQAILPRLKSDIMDIILASIKGEIASLNVHFSADHSVNVVLASGGYPSDNFDVGFAISGLSSITQNNHVNLFYAGAIKSDGNIVTSGGRVLSICATGKSNAEARNIAYEAVSKISFKGMHYRSDIAKF